MTLIEALASSRPVSAEIFEIWIEDADGKGSRCIGRRYKGELKEHLTEGLEVGSIRASGTNGAYVIRTH